MSFFLAWFCKASPPANSPVKRVIYITCRLPFRVTFIVLNNTYIIPTTSKLPWSKDTLIQWFGTHLVTILKIYTTWICRQTTRAERIKTTTWSGFRGSVAGNYDVSIRCTELLARGTHPRRHRPSVRLLGQAHCSHCWTMLNCLANTWVKDAQQASNLILSDFFDSGCSLFWLLTSQRMICRCCVHSVLLEVYSIIVYSVQSKFQSDSCLSLRVGSPTYADPHQL